MPDRTSRNLFLKRGLIVAALFGVAFVLRLYGIGAEPFWRDEVYSVAFSDTSPREVLEDTARDVHPPLYYLGLYEWRRTFGDSDVGLRAYSLVWSLIGLLAIFLLARDVGGVGVAIVALLLASLNALDIYAAQEARMYSQAAALLTLSSGCLWRWIAACASAKGPLSWLGWAAGYALFALAALYTHYLSVMVLLAQGSFVLFWFGWRRQWASIAGYLVCAAVVAFAFLPWFIFVRDLRGSLYSSSLGWLTVAPISDYFSFLGREFFWGQARQVHDRCWIPSMILPALILAVSAWQLYRNRPGNSRRPTDSHRLSVVYLLWLLAVPVLLAAVTVWFYHPIYFRPRFSQFVLGPFLVLAAIACHAFGGLRARRLATAVIALAMLAGTRVQQRTYQRIFWENFERARTNEGAPAFVVFFPRHLEDTARRDLGWLPPSLRQREFERFFDEFKGSKIWVCSLIGYNYDGRRDEFDYYQRLLGSGSVRQINVPTGFHVQIVAVGEPSMRDAQGHPLDRWYGPRDIAGRIEGFDKSGRFHTWEYDRFRKAPFRWSKAEAWFSLGDEDNISTVVMNVEFPSLDPARYQPKLRIYAQRGENVSGLFDSPSVATIPDSRAGAFEVRVTAPQGKGRLWIGWKVEGVNLLRAGLGADPRELGLRINWVGTIHGPNQTSPGERSDNRPRSLR